MLLEKLEDRTPILLDSTTVQNMKLDQEEIESGLYSLKNSLIAFVFILV